MNPTPQAIFRATTLTIAVVAASQVQGMEYLPILQTALASAGATNQQSASESKINDLKARAEKMNEHDRGRVYSDIAREWAEVANQQFVDGHPEQADASIHESVAYAEKATTAANLRGKKIKDTEINLRQCARRLEEIRRSVALEQQAPIKQAVTRIDQLRKELLDRMFKRE